MSLTGAHISAALKAAGAPLNGLVASPDAIAKMFNDAMGKYAPGQFDTNNKVAALLSECMMESAFFRTTQEYANTGPYQPYRGRTFIQLTWKANYAKFGAWCKSVGLLTDANYFVNNPKKLADLKWAALGGVWYFTKVMFSGKPLTAYSDNIMMVGKAVNMGSPFSNKKPNGWKAREDAYKAVLSVGNLVAKPQPKEEHIMAVGTDVHFWNNVDQKLEVGDNEVIINEGTNDKTVVSGENAGVDVVGVVEIDNPFGYTTRVFWRVLDYDENTPKTKTNGIGIPAVGSTRQVAQASYKGSIPKPSAAGRSMRLRLIVKVDPFVQSIPGEVVPALPKINNIHIDGWKL